MNQSIQVQLFEQRIIWRCRREDFGVALFNHFEESVSLFHNRSFGLLINLHSIRYILPNDQRLILQIIKQSQAYPLVGLAYVVDAQNFFRMNILLSLSELPYKKVVFKSEEKALDYLSHLTVNTIMDC